MRDLISRMTLAEKAKQLGHTAPAIPRLGVPEYNWWNEGLHGVARAGVATVFPQAIGMAASWDVPLMQQAADIISTEFRAKYAATVHPDGGSDWYRGLTAWSPNINIFRDPRWGRGQETYGEDPYLTSRMGVAFVTGLQGNDPKYLKVVATPKHFAVHSGPEATRHSADIKVSRHDLEDTYLPAFRATVMEAKAQSVMCAYNGVNGQPACANDTLLGEHLRKDWGFQGYVVSDCGAAADIFIKEGLHYAPNAEAGVTAGFKAGMDLICGDYRRNMTTDPDAIVNAVRRGLMQESVLDQALTRLFTTRVKLGMFDPPGANPYARIPVSANDTPEHREVALRMAKASLVLLKNQDNLLPLKKPPARIAVIGPNADNLDALVGNYNGTPSHPVTVLEGIRKRFPQSKVTYVQGTGLVGPVTTTVPESALCVDAACTSHGLKAEYFSNITLTGAAAKSRVDRTIDFVVSASHNDPPLPPGYSARWTGVLKAPESGEYRIGFTGDDGYRVWVDGKLVTEDWTDHEPATTQTPKIQLQAGHTYPVRIEYFQKSPIGEARFVWSLPSARGDDAVEAARNADLVVMVAGLSPRIEGEEMKVDAAGFAGGDRTSLDLPAPQQSLLERVNAVGKPVVLVLMNGSALGVNWADQNIPAIVEAWYPGGEGGTAVAALLAGDFSPAGRLPVTFYKSVDQLPPFDDYSMSKRTYRYFTGEPLYPFGYGLSFTKFDYANVRTSKASVGPSDAVTVSVDVTNSGAMDGDEVVQLYVTHRGVAGAPIRALQGFQRIHLRKGEKKTVEFTLRDRALSIVDVEGKRRIVPGEVDVWVGGGQPVRRSGLASASGVQTRFALTGEMTLPD
ncbi:MAG TPA: glycoside hydrolase family 3 C-terminal domain-containing protein [Steroidobacteraceae bacterium]|nr:glycoside hydrolase family 3 C-terminal domain-containing protein [Steroidobacteraceae bacterium]